MNDVVKPVAQHRIDTGGTTGWAYFLAAGSMGKETKCDAIMRYSYENKFPEPGQSTLQTDLEKSGVKMTVAQYIEKRNALSELVASEKIVRVTGFGEIKKGDYFQVNLMRTRPGKGSDFVKFEREVWMPLAKAAADAAHARKAWSLWYRLYPAGTAESHDFITVDAFRSWDAIWQPQGFPSGIVDKVHPGKTIQQLFQPMDTLREIAHRELYSVRDMIRTTGSASREAKR